MAATEQNTQKQIETLQEMAFKALLFQAGNNPGFFKSYPEIPIWEERASVKLLDCVSFGRRREAATYFNAWPGLLVWRGTLTDIAHNTYENIAAFEYAVLVKDSYFVRDVIDLLEVYQGENRHRIVADLIKQFDKYFSEERLAAVTRFINACDAWRTAIRGHIWHEDRYHFVQGIVQAQKRFPAHVLQEYCHPDRSFGRVPEFNESSLPEELSFCHFGTGLSGSLLTEPPGVAGNAALLRAGGKVAWLVAGQAEGIFDRFLAKDCAAMEALDKARTAELLRLRARLLSILTPPNSPESHDDAMPCCAVL